MSPVVSLARGVAALAAASASRGGHAASALRARVAWAGVERVPRGAA